MPQSNTSSNNNNDNILDESMLAYLREVLPACAKCLEQHPTMANFDSYGRTNAHGKPLDTHVAGICHYFPHQSISDLATLLDVYLPLRLALSPSNFHHHQKKKKKNNEGSSIENDDDWEAVMVNTDLILHDVTTSENNGSSLEELSNRWKEIWNLQAVDQCKETYAVCRTESDIVHLQKLYDERCSSG